MEEKLQSLFRVLEEEGIRCPIYFTVYDNKKDNVKPSYLWHCRLDHINERRMAKLHKSRNLGSFDYESYDTCESCLLGKITKLSFKGKVNVQVGL